MGTHRYGMRLLSVVWLSLGVLAGCSGATEQLSPESTLTGAELRNAACDHLANATVEDSIRRYPQDRTDPNALRKDWKAVCLRQLAAAKSAAADAWGRCLLDSPMKKAAGSVRRLCDAVLRIHQESPVRPVPGERRRPSKTPPAAVDQAGLSGPDLWRMGCRRFGDLVADSAAAAQRARYGPPGADSSAKLAEKASGFCAAYCSLALKPAEADKWSRTLLDRRVRTFEQFVGHISARSDTEIADSLRARDREAVCSWVTSRVLLTRRMRILWQHKTLLMAELWGFRCRRELAALTAQQEERATRCLACLDSFSEQRYELCLAAEGKSSCPAPRPSDEKPNGEAGAGSAGRTSEQGEGDELLTGRLLWRAACWHVMEVVLRQVASAEGDAFHAPSFGEIESAMRACRTQWERQANPASADEAAACMLAADDFRVISRCLEAESEDK